MTPVPAFGCKASAGLLATLILASASYGQATIGMPVREVPAQPQQPVAAEKQLHLPLTRPTSEQLFRLESEGRMLERMAEEYRTLGQKKVLFPVGPVISFEARHSAFAALTTGLDEPDFCSRPRYFANELPERYGVYVPLLQPILSTTRFYLDTLFLPIHMVLEPPWSSP